MNKSILIAALTFWPTGALAGTLLEVPYPDTKDCKRPIVKIVNLTYIYRDGDAQPMGTNATGDYVASCAGVVAWVDSSHYLHKGVDPLNPMVTVRSYVVNDYTGTVVWFPGSGDLSAIYKDSQRLGDRVSSYQVAAFTGDVVWKDQWGNLYKNSVSIAGNAVNYEVTPDGRVSWIDNVGRPHFLEAGR